MSDLENIAADLRRQREQLEKSLKDATSRADSTAELIRKIEELSRRAEESRSVPRIDRPPRV